MWNTRKPCALLFLLLPFNLLLAQPDSVGFIPRTNVLKIGLTSSIFKTLSINYERVLSPKWSAALTVSYMVPITPGGALALNTNELIIGADRRLMGYYITPEVKWYLEKSDRRPAPRGLYLGAYLRYSDTRYTASLSAVASGSDAGGRLATDLKIDLVEFGAGPAVGYQFLCIHDRLAIDVLFFAPRWALYRLELDADLDGEGALYDDLSQAVEELLGRGLVRTDIRLSNSGSTTIDRHSIGYRCGIKLGYAF